MKTNQHAFTLVELLVVVLIIATLSAVAIPQYKKAVLKSRFSNLLPITKNVQTSNEVYFLANQEYANNLNQLDVAVPSDTGLQISLGADPQWAYVQATQEGLKNNYLAYQKNSENYPGETHCEAQTGDEQANWLCEKALHGKKLRSSITSGYTTYVLEGNGQGMTPAEQAIAQAWYDAVEILMAALDKHIEDNGYAETSLSALEGVDPDQIAQMISAMPRYHSNFTVSCSSQQYCSILIYARWNNAPVNIQLIKGEGQYGRMWNLWFGQGHIPICQYWVKQGGRLQSGTQCPS